MSTIVILAIMFVLFCLLFALMGRRWQWIGEPQWMFSFSLAITWILGMSFNSHFWTSGDSMEARPFTNHLREQTIDVFGPEFAFKHWWQTPFESIPVVDLQKDETISDKVVIRSLDGMPIEVEFEMLRRVVESGLREFLSFSPTVVDYRVKSVVVDRLQRLFGINSWETISKHRTEVIEWVSKIFGGDDEQSPFEKHFGILVYNPKLKHFDAIGQASETITQAKAKSDKLVEVIKQLKQELPHIRDDKEILRVAQRMLDIDLPETRNIIDAPKGIHTVAVGGASIVAGGGKRGR